VPEFSAPEGSAGGESRRRVFDSHFHIIDPRFPLTPNKGYLPQPFTVPDYLDRMAPLDLAGGAVVSASFQGSDQSYLLDALDRLGPRFVGVTQVPASVTDHDVMKLHANGVRAVRFNLYRGGSESVEQLGRLASRVHDLAGWHVELYADSKDLPHLEPRLAALPRIVIDHLGMTREGYPPLLRLVERGARV